MQSSIDAAGVAAELYEQLSRREKMFLLRENSIEAEAEGVTDEEAAEVAAVLLKMLRDDEEMPQSAALRLEDKWWHAQYAVFCDLSNDNDLLDCLEAFGVNLFGVHIGRRGYALDGYEPYGFQFVFVKRKDREKAEAAFKHYVKKENWKDDKFRGLCQSVMCDFLLNNEAE